MTDKNEKEDDIIQDLALKNIVPELYKDLLQPSVKELGSNLVVVSKAISIALAPLEVTVWGYDKVSSWLSEKLSSKFANKDPNSIRSPPLNVAGPAIVNMTFTSDQPNLRELYANLIASSMDSNKSDGVHPSFVQIIEQLHSDEALFLSYIGTKDQANKWMISAYFDETSYPKVSIDSQFKQDCVKAKVVFENNCSTYLDNFLRLRILKKNDHF